jgi:hypothetical protein
MGKASAPVMMDGIQIGTVTVGDESEVSPDPLGNNFAFGPAPSPAAFPQRFASREMPGNDVGGTIRSPHATQPHSAPHRRTLGGPHEQHERHLDPHNRTRTAESDKPQHMTVGDVKSAVERTPGGVDRSSIAKELAGNEALQRRYAQMVKGEVLGNATNHARIVQAETAANRALIRGHSLERALWDQAHHGDAGYYPQKTFTRDPITDEEFAAFKRDVLPQVLAGSDYAHGFTGNASADVAARQKRHGTPTFDLRAEGGDQYFNEGPFTHPLPRLPGTPQGVTRLPTAPGSADVAPVTNPSAAGQIRMAPGRTPEGAHMELSTIDPRLREIVGAANAQFENLHPGYTVEAFSGRRHGANQGPHASETGALDLQIRDPFGRVIPSEGRDSSGLYKQLAQIAKGEQMARHPGLKDRFNWGGAFETYAGSGEEDLMHMDLSGVRGHYTHNRIDKLGPLPGLKYGQAPEQPKTKAAEIHGTAL